MGEEEGEVRQDKPQGVAPQAVPQAGGAEHHGDVLPGGDVADVPVVGGVEGGGGESREVERGEDQHLWWSEGAGQQQEAAGGHEAAQEEAAGDPELQAVSDSQDMSPAPDDGPVDGDIFLPPEAELLIFCLIII